MKIAKKVLAIALAVGMIFCLTAMAFAAQGTTLVASEVANGKFTVSVVVTDAEGLQSFDKAVTYTTEGVSVVKVAKDGAYKAEYESVGETIMTAYNFETEGTVLPGIAIGNEIYSDAKLAELRDDVGEDAPTATTAALTLFTLTFKTTTENGSCTITCDGATKTVTWGEVVETTTEAPVEETTEAPRGSETDPIVDETTTAAEETTIAGGEDETKPAGAVDETTTAAAATGEKAEGTVNTGDTAVLAVAGAVCALAGAAYVVTKKRK